MNDLISRQAAIKAICEDGTMLERQGKYTMTMAERKQKDADILDTLPPAQPVVISKSENATECEDAVSRFEVLRLIDYSSNDLNDSVDNWYFQGKVKELPSVTPKQPGWTYIEEELPETIINEHTHDYQEYNCLCDFGDNGFDVRTYKFGNGHFWNGGGIVDKYVTAWQPLPEIPDALKPTPWKGGQDGV